MNFFFTKFNSFNIYLNGTSLSRNVFFIEIFNIGQINNMSFSIPKGIRDIRAKIIDQYFMKAINFLL